MNIYNNRNDIWTHANSFRKLNSIGNDNVCYMQDLEFESQTPKKLVHPN